MMRKSRSLLDYFHGRAPDDDIPPDIQALEEALLALHRSDQETRPSDGLWDRITSRITRDAAAPGTATIRPDEGVWEPLGPGIERRLVNVDRNLGRQCFFIRMKAGSVLPSHEHSGDEHCVVLEGSLAIGAEIYGPGTYHLATEGIPHVAIIAQSDALFFIQGGL